MDDIDSALEVKFVDGMKGDLLFFLIEVDHRFGIFEIVALDDLFAGLIEGVIHFLQIDFRDDVERVLLCHEF